MKRIDVTCTMCPAPAVVHHAMRLVAEDRAVAWVECHGEHRFVSIDGEVEDAAIESGTALLWLSLPDEPVQKHLDDSEAWLVEAKRRSLSQRFIASGEEQLAMYRRVVEAMRK